MWAVEEARQRNGQIRLVTAWSKPPLAWYAAVLETAAGEIVAEDSPQEIAETLQADALKTARKRTRGWQPPGKVVHNEVRRAAAVLDAAEDADLVVVGSRGHGSYPSSPPLGSVATQVISHAPCPRPRRPAQSRLRRGRRRPVACGDRGHNSPLAKGLSRNRCKGRGGGPTMWPQPHSGDHLRDLPSKVFLTHFALPESWI